MRFEDVTARLTFRREGEQTYVIGTLDDQQLDSLDAAMLHAHHPPSLLPVIVSRENGTCELAYDIGHRKPLHEWLRMYEMSEHEVLQAVLHICNGLLALRNYLLDEHRCLLVPEWMFVGESAADLKLLYWPSAAAEEEDEERKLANRLHHLCLKLAPHLSDMQSLRELLSSFDDPVFTLHALRRRIIHLLDHMEAARTRPAKDNQREGTDRYVYDACRKWLRKLKLYGLLEQWKAEKQVVKPASTYTVPVRAAKQTPGQASLLFHPPGRPSVVIPISRLPFMIGRDPRLSDWTWDDAKLSRVHAELKRVGDHYAVRDVGSRNGTYLNGEQLAPYTDSLLTHGDRLELAGLCFQFSWERPDHMI